MKRHISRQSGCMNKLNLFPEFRAETQEYAANGRSGIDSRRQATKVRRERSPQSVGGGVPLPSTDLQIHFPGCQKEGRQQRSDHETVDPEYRDAAEA